MPNLISPLSILSKWNLGNHLICEGVDNRFVLVLSINLLALLRVSGGAGNRNKQLMVDLVIGHPIRRIVLIKLNNSTVEGFLMNSIYPIVVAVSRIDFPQISRRNDPRHLRN